MSSTSSFRTLIATHLVVFGAGVVVGNSLNADELSAYRSANESWASKLRRQATIVSLGAASIAVVILAVRTVRRS
jgi:hypothetical protein